MTQRLLSARQVRDILEVDASTIYRMAGDGRLPAVKVGRQWRFPADQIERLLSGNEGRPVLQAEPLTTELAEAVVRMAAKALGVMMVFTDMAGEPLTVVANPVDILKTRCRRP